MLKLGWDKVLKGIRQSRFLMILYRFVMEWWMENATSDGIENLIIEGLDSESMSMMVKEFHESTGGYDFKKFKKYLAGLNAYLYT